MQSCSVHASHTFASGRCPVLIHLADLGVLPCAAAIHSINSVRCNSSSSMETAATSGTTAAAPGGLVDRMRGALWGVLIADALSMPVHW